MRLLVLLCFLAACPLFHTQAAETNNTIDIVSSGGKPLVVSRGEGTNQYFEINPFGVPAYSERDLVSNSNLAGVGPWSEAVFDGHGNSLRGRLLVYWGRKTTNALQKTVWSDAPTYVEIEDVTATNQHPTRVYFDLRGHLPFELRDARGQPPTHLSNPVLRGAHAPTIWATLPARGRIRVRSDAYKGGSQGNDGELRLLFFNKSWMIPPGDTNLWSLSATLLPPLENADPDTSNVWQGTLKIPGVKLSVVKPDLN